MPSTVLQGLPASPGIAVGRCWTVDRRRVRTPRRKVAPEEVDAELARLEAAIELSVNQLDGVKAKMQSSDGAEHLAILEVHRAMLRDPSLVDEARRLVREERVNVEWAVKRAVRKIKSAFDPDDEFFRERRSDVDYVGERIVKNLLGQGAEVVEPPPPGSIVVARDLSPADTALFFHDRRVAGLVTDVGGVTSHTAIVARALEIPAVVGVGRASAAAERGDWVVVDGSHGVVVVNPTPGERADYEAARIRHLEREAELARLKDLPAETLDGVRIRMVGNIEFGEEVPGLLSHGGEGVGLYRTEFLYLGRTALPDEEDHYRDYRSILDAMGGRPVTVRTFDLGGDKLPSGQKDHSENPALGLRAVRYCLRHPDLFQAQLRAAVRAAAHGNLRLMFPMVSGLAELRAAMRMLAEACDEVEARGVPFRMPPVGVMVELPSAAVVADRLAAEVDFLSIGTNDLIQYTIGVDRQNKDVAYLYKPLHLAVLRTLRTIADAARAAGKPVSMCGEMAGEPLYTLVLLGLGLDELSMNGPSIPLVKRVIRSASARDGRALLDRILGLTTAEDIEREVRSEMTRRFPGLLEEGGAVGPASG
ncbi:MAG TPA: phosphoenolpyruvate--protein phosphotransferase [Anaeromyxobacteraceae bacterium]|jgi:phosphotransferase system enzyme I (PtsI)|nr:phosphoenolpyruvate--protein phosphotransferase [Anaeromyxobacteraceae bacterium]